MQISIKFTKNMKRYFYFSVLLFSTAVVWGQNVPKPLNAEFLIEEGIKLHDKELYDSARSCFLQITRNDSLYGTACYEIAYGFYLEKNYDSALVYIKKAVNDKRNSGREQARVMMGTIFDDAGMADSALACYQTSLKLMPYNSKLLYDLGCTYYRLDSLDLAEQYLIQAITINPAYYRATLMLGRLNEKKNRIVEAMLCYYMASLLNPSASLVQMVELYLSGESEIVPLRKEYEPTSPSFEKIADYVNSKIAMTAKYKPVFKSPTAFARQGDILFKYLEYDPKIDNFYMNYYVRLFTFIRDKKLTETTMYVCFSDLNFENVQKWLKTNASKVQKFYGVLGNEVWRLAAKGFVNENKYNGMAYLFSNGTLSEFGKYSDEKNKTKTGLWQTVGKNGAIASTLNYQNGKAEGEMQEFNQEGQLITRAAFVNGLKSGGITLYHDNGQLKADGSFENDKLHGKVTRYFYTGQKRGEENYKNDAANGLFISYFKNGVISDSISYSNGKQNGTYCSMYANNQLSTKGQVVNDLADGEIIRYYPDGQISSRGNMTKSNQTGKWIDYYPNGAIKTVAFYNDKGNLTDTAKNFDANGLLLSILIYSNNGKNIQKTVYRPDGTILGKEEIKNENVIKIENFDKDGKSFEEIKIEVSNKETPVKYRNWLGNFNQEGTVKNGKFEGRWIKYGSFGNIEQLCHFKKGELNGTDTTFFPNGKIKAVENFKEGKYDGYAVYYNKAGKITAEGYFVNDVQEGYWLYYNELGNIINRFYFSEGEPDQWQQTYHPNGNLSREFYYNNYIMREIINYDTTGYAYEHLIIPDSVCQIVEHFPNGKTKSEIHYIGGISNGLATFFYGNGQKTYSYNMLMNKIFDTLKTYDEAGKYIGTIAYIDGKIYGKRTVINANDNEHIEMQYFNNQTFDTVKTYNAENKLILSTPQMEDEKHGWASYYEDNGELAYKILYHNGIAIECFSPKNSEHIPVENGKKITTYYASGGKSAEISFLNGYRDGEYRRYYANGKLLLQAVYETGEYNGIYREYYSNGNLKEESNYIYDDLDGTVKRYHPNGKLKSEEFYVFGKKHGEQKQYNQQGGLVKKTVYYYGEIQSN